MTDNIYDLFQKATGAKSIRDRFRINRQHTIRLNDEKREALWGISANGEARRFLREQPGDFKRALVALSYSRYHNDRVILGRMLAEDGVVFDMAQQFEMRGILKDVLHALNPILFDAVISQPDVEYVLKRHEMWNSIMYDAEEAGKFQTNASAMSPPAA